MKTLIKFWIIGISCLFLQCSASHSRDITRPNEKPFGVQRSPELLTIDPEWRVQVTSTSIDLRGQWEASCSSKKDCWYWTSSKLFVYDQNGLREIQVRLSENEYILDASPLSGGSGWVVTTAGLFQISNSNPNLIHIAVPDLDAPKGRIHAAYFVDDKQGWVAGGVYRALADHEVAPNNALSDDRKRILVGALARTLDGGLTWQTIRFDKSIGRFDEIVFSQQLGLASGDAGFQATSDGGETWRGVLSGQRNLPLDRTQVNATFVLDEKHSWATINRSHLLTTQDGARTWKMIPQPADSNQDIPPFAEIAFIDEQRGLALQNYFGGGHIYKTNDGGKTWTRLELNAGLSGLVLVRGRNEVLAIGNNGLYSFARN